MALLIDAHVHVYAHYDTARLLAAFHARIRAVGATTGVMMLAEREGTDVFADWAAGKNLPDTVEALPSDPTALVLRQPGAPDIVVVAGRQIACAERVEILALATRQTFHDGTPAAAAMEQTRAAGALPVLAWGVGKWLFGRARIVDGLIQASQGQPLFIADPALRPVFWPTPILMRKARALGHRVLAGSDPLPPETEATRVGQYAELAPDSALDPAAPLTPQIRSILSTHPLRHTGRRAGCLDFLRNLTGKNVVPVHGFTPPSRMGCRPGRG